MDLTLFLCNMRNIISLDERKYNSMSHTELIHDLIYDIVVMSTSAISSAK